MNLREKNSGVGGASEVSEGLESVSDPELDEALTNFRSSVHAWSAAEFSRVRPAVTAKRQWSWRPAAGWALAGVMVAVGASGGFYEHQQQKLRIAAAAQVAEQQQAARELQAREDEEDLLAKVDSDVSQTVPSAMEPLAQLMAEDESR